MQQDIGQWIVFGIFTVFTIAGGIGVATTRNLFHAALWLIACLFGVAGFFVMLSAPFLAAIQILVYIGAIAILIIFAIMLTRRLMGLREVTNHQWGLGAGVAALAFLVIAAVLVLASSGDAPLLAREPVALLGDGIRDFGVALVDPQQYALPFILASVLLEAAMVGAIVIAREDEG
ncbi:MAG: NADH-quinone oxidoreductase subunit J [Anaerolineae bacterium]